jgi:hypothetical protein
MYHLPCYCTKLSIPQVFGPICTLILSFLELGLKPGLYNLWRMFVTKTTSNQYNDSTQTPTIVQNPNMFTGHMITC